MKDVTGHSPDHDDREGGDESPGAPKDSGGSACEDAEGIPNAAKEVAFLFFPWRFLVVGIFCDSNYWIVCGARLGRIARIFAS
jgi:hypothetical protein